MEYIKVVLRVIEIPVWCCWFATQITLAIGSIFIGIWGPDTTLIRILANEASLLSSMLVIGWLTICVWRQCRVNEIETCQDFMENASLINGIKGASNGSFWIIIMLSLLSNVATLSSYEKAAIIDTPLYLLIIVEKIGAIVLVGLLATILAAAMLYLCVMGTFYPQRSSVNDQQMYSRLNANADSEA